jgi:hypothetical protein
MSTKHDPSVAKPAAKGNGKSLTGCYFFSGKATEKAMASPKTPPIIAIEISVER